MNYTILYTVTLNKLFRIAIKGRNLRQSNELYKHMLNDRVRNTSDFGQMIFNFQIAKYYGMDQKDIMKAHQTFKENEQEIKPSIPKASVYAIVDDLKQGWKRIANYLFIDPDSR